MFERAPIIFLLIVTSTLQQSAATIHHASVNAAEDSPNAAVRSFSNEDENEQSNTLLQLSDLIKKVAGSEGGRYTDAITKHTASLAKYGVLVLTKPSKLVEVGEIVKDLESREWASYDELNRHLGDILHELNEVDALKPFNISSPDFKKYLFSNDESEGKMYTKKFLNNWAVIFKYRSLELIKDSKLAEGEKLFKEPTYQWSDVKEFLIYRETVKQAIQKLNDS